MCTFPLPSPKFPVWPIRGWRTDSPQGLFPALNSMTAPGNSISKGPEAGLSHSEAIVLPGVLSQSSGCVSEDEKGKDSLNAEEIEAGAIGSGSHCRS